MVAEFAPGQRLPAWPRSQGALVGLLCGVATVLWGWGYTVDDALITARVAANLSAGLGYRVNPAGELVDAVTPLGYAHLLALARPENALAALHIARVAGGAAWIFTLSVVGAQLATFGARGLAWLGLMSFIPGGGAWATSGMETPWVALMVALGAGLLLATRSAESGELSLAKRFCKPAEGAEPSALLMAGAPSAAPQRLGAPAERSDTSVILTDGARAAAPERLGTPAERSGEPLEAPAAVIRVADDLGFKRRLVGALCLGCAVAWRPELLPMAFVLWLGGMGRCSSWARRASVLALGMGPSALVILLRLAWFDSPAPLSALAKPSDLSHGLRYAVGGWILSGGLAVTAPLALRRLSYQGRVTMAALFAHAVSLTLVGGDWMALFRLYVPALPLMVWVAAELSWRTGWGAQLGRAALVLAAAGLLQWHSGVSARQVAGDRLRLIAAARPHLSGLRVAALDVGWVGAAGAEVVDLAGVADPTIAILPGGHTSKQVDPGLLQRRRAEAVVLLYEPGAEQPARQVERRLTPELMELTTGRSVTLTLGNQGQKYLIYYLQEDL